MKIIVCLFLLFNVIQQVDAKCQGRFLNPITDICWSCLFPMTIGGITVAKGGGEDTPNSKQLVCVCRKPPLNLPTPGIPISFWEPVRLVEVTRTPFCLLSMGGLEMGGRAYQKGSVSTSQNRRGLAHSFYHAHYYVYPVIYWLELLTDFLCLEKASLDVAFLSELDPLWDDDEANFILHPESGLFSNPIAQAACAGDCALCSVGFSNDSLFWCDGCHGSLYPYSGSVASHVGGVQASLLVTGKVLSLMHRMHLAWGTCGKEGLCDKYPMPILKKTQYKTQMTYPIPTQNCHPLGRSETLWASGKEYPYGGEDFAYLIWRKRNCCML